MIWVLFSMHVHSGLSDNQSLLFKLDSVYITFRLITFIIFILTQIVAFAIQKAMRTWGWK